MISAGPQPLCPLAVSWAVDVSSSLSLLHLLDQVRKIPSNAPPVAKVYDDPAVPFLILATQAILCPLSIRIIVRAPCTGGGPGDSSRSLPWHRFQPEAPAADRHAYSALDCSTSVVPHSEASFSDGTVCLHGAKFQPIAWYILSPTEFRSYCMLTGPT